MWLGTGSKTTKRGAEPRWPSTVRCGSRRTERKRSGKNSAATGTVDLPFFPLASVLSAGGQSRLCASLRPLRGAKNAALTNLPLRSCVASSHRKNVRNKWGPRKHPLRLRRKARAQPESTRRPMSVWALSGAHPVSIRCCGMCLAVGFAAVADGQGGVRADSV